MGKNSELRKIYRDLRNISLDIHNTMASITRMLVENGENWESFADTDKIAAIKMCRVEHNVDLRTAKDMVDTFLEEKMK